MTAIVVESAGLVVRLTGVGHGADVLMVSKNRKRRSCSLIFFAGHLLPACSRSIGAPMAASELRWRVRKLSFALGFNH